MNLRVSDSRVDRAFLVALLVASALGTCLGIPWAIAVLGDPASVWLSTLVEGPLLLVPASAAGVWLGKRAGLASDLRELVSNTSAGWARLRPGLFPAGAIGLALGLIGFFAQRSVPGTAWVLGLRNPTPLDWLLRSLSAAITEEILFRLGLIALVSWVILSIVKRAEIRVFSLWVGNMVSALLFAVAHLPQLSGHASALHVALITYSTAAGLVMGAVFLRYGLVSAVVAHFTCDLVANVIPRLLANAHP